VHGLAGLTQHKLTLVESVCTVIRKTVLAWRSSLNTKSVHLYRITVLGVLLSLVPVFQCPSMKMTCDLFFKNNLYSLSSNEVREKTTLLIHLTKPQLVSLFSDDLFFHIM
jgi:hypothetical protein